VQDIDRLQPAIARSTDKTPHFDVIIYDRLESPVLLGTADHSALGRSLAIPAEHVVAVIEIKSRFTTASVKLAEPSSRIVPLISPMKKSRFDQAASSATVMTSAAICASHAATTTTTIASAV
jgi:hypothetical protein